MDRQDGDVETESCGCAADPRRLCDVCRTDTHVFLACSFRCLARHVVAAHGTDVATETAARMRAFQQELNRHAPSVWDRYATHREMLMGHVPVAPEGVGKGEVGVFGAGSCSDVDLERLAHVFGRVHLIDLDGGAIERARDRQPPAVRDRVVLHGDVDLSGFLDRLDSWGDAFPADADLGQAAVASAHAIVRAAGGPFDVTVSSCVLSQLMQPFQSAWILAEEAWTNLDAAVTAVHLATLAGATSPGGSGFIAFDVLSSQEVPELADLAGHAPEELQAFIDCQRGPDALVLQPDPDNLLVQLGSPGLGALFASPRLTPPWLWDIGDAIQLVYGLQFQRR